MRVVVNRQFETNKSEGHYKPPMIDINWRNPEPPIKDDAPRYFGFDLDYK